jgi:riboflavin biosynthesis pyrimidine reductase
MARLALIVPTVTRFEIHCLQRERLAISARLSGFRTVAEETSGKEVVAIGNEWTRRLFDGDFYRSRAGTTGRPLTSLVFVQSRDGNTVASDPATLGGGDTDTHLVYEGLSRVDADAVMAGAATARGEDTVFSIWHPELVSLRVALGHARHPAQVVVSDNGNLPVERGLMFTEPALRVFIITRTSSVAAMRCRLVGRPWVEVIDAGEPLSLTMAMGCLHRRGLEVISAVGGRRTATALLREGLVSDLYLTTSPVSGGEPNTPLYEGPRLALSRVVAKVGQGTEAGVRFEHFLVPPVPV